MAHLKIRWTTWWECSAGLFSVQPAETYIGSMTALANNKKPATYLLTSKTIVLPVVNVGNVDCLLQSWAEYILKVLDPTLRIQSQNLSETALYHKNVNCCHKLMLSGHSFATAAKTLFDLNPLFSFNMHHTNCMLFYILHSVYIEVPLICIHYFVLFINSHTVVSLF